MIAIIMRKEIRETLTSSKFLLLYLVCSVLVLLTFYAGVENYQSERAKYEAALAANLRQMEGLSDWAMIRHHIYLPPLPLHMLVNGISNDIGRNTEMFAIGELEAADSIYNERPMFALYRYLDLNFIFLVVISLFAILLAYNSVNGEKESGTLKLIFANAVPRDQFILGKLFGGLLSLIVPVLLPFLLGLLILRLVGYPLSADDWLKLCLIVLCGILYSSVFLIFAILMSASSRHSATSFLTSLVFWICAVFIVPRVAVLLSGQITDVPSVDSIASQKYHFRSQLWNEDMQKLNKFTSSDNLTPQEMMQEFRSFMSDLAEERNRKISDFNGKINASRTNRQQVREKLAFGLARISPAAAFSLAAMGLAGSGIGLKQDYIDQAMSYQQVYRKFLSQRTDSNLPGHGARMRMIRIGEEEPEPINPSELPVFSYKPPALAMAFTKSMMDFSILVMFNLVFFVLAVFRFLRFDVR